MDEVTTKVELQLEGEAAALAVQLAELRGITVPEAVTEAVRHDLQRERLHKEKVRRILEAAASVRATMKPPLPTSDHSWLYDENGLPE